MKRDMDLVRDILLRMEAATENFHMYGEMTEGHAADADRIIAHMQMLASGGYLQQRQSGVYEITWAGHEFIDTVRDPEIWRKTKAGADKVGSWSVKLLAELASGLITAKARELGLPL